MRTFCDNLKRFRQGKHLTQEQAAEDYVRADREYKKLLQSGQATAKDLRLYGILHQHMMYVCIKKAEELFDRVIRLGPEEDEETYWSVRRQKGYFLWEIGRNGQYIEEFLPLVEGGSDKLQEWVCLIQAYSFAGEYQTAWEWLEKAAEKFPESATLHIYAGDLLRDMGRYEEAFPHWQRAMELEPDWLDAAYSMAACHEKLGNYGQAGRLYDRIAHSLARRGFEEEVALPRSLANRCREKQTG